MHSKTCSLSNPPDQTARPLLPSLLPTQSRERYCIDFDFDVCLWPSPAAVAPKPRDSESPATSGSAQPCIGTRSFLAPLLGMVIHVICAAKTKEPGPEGCESVESTPAAGTVLAEAGGRPGKAVGESLLRQRQPVQKCQLEPRKGNSFGKALESMGELTPELTSQCAQERLSHRRYGRGWVTSFVQETESLS